MGQIDKFNKRFSQLRKDPQTSQEGVTAQPEPQIQAPAQPQSKKNKDKKTEKNTAPRTKKTVEKQTQPLYDHTLPEDVATGLRDYLYSDADDDYSDAVDKYIEAKDAKPREKVSHALNIIDFMREEFKKRPDKSQPKQPHLNRPKLAEIAAILYYDSEANPKVAAKVEKFLARVSLVSANDYLHAISDVRKRRVGDKFLESMSAAHKSVIPNNESSTLWSGLVTDHIQSVLEKIEKQENKDDKKIQNDKIRYARLLRDNDFGAYIPDELLKALEADDKRKSDKQKQAKDKKSANTGDKPMTDEIKDDTAAPAGTENTEDTEKKKQENNKEQTFNPSFIQKWACRYISEDYKQFKNEQELLDALSSKGILIQGNNVIDLTMESVVYRAAPRTNEEAKAQEAKKYMERDDGLDLSDLPSKEDKLREEHKDAEPITVSPLNKEEKTEEKTEEKDTPVDKTWIEKKVENYKAMEAENKIGKINITQGLNKEDKEFEVEVDGGTIHYASPNSVSISNDAQIKTFEAVLMEDDNIGRPINFGETMPHDMAVRLAAACVLHGNKMQGSFPQELTDADKEMLKSELGDRYEQFAAAWENRNKPAEEKKNDGKEEPKEEHKEDHKKDRAQISTPEELGKAVESLEGIKEKFEQMKSDGLIAVSTNLETKKPEIVAGPAMKDKTEEEQKKVVDDANALIASAAAIVQSSKTVSGKLNEEQAKQNNAFNEARLQHIRENMDQQKLAEHDSLTKEARAERLAQWRADMSVKLGITNDPKNEKKALTGKELDDYIGQGKITIKNYADLWEKAHEGQKFDVKNLKPEEKSVFMQISKTQLDRTKSLQGKGNSREK